MRLLYRIYQLFIAAPLLILITILTSIVTIIGSTIGSAHFWGYWPASIWSKLMCRMLFLPVHIEGRENTDDKTSYVYVANHQGAFDIFLVYGYLGHNFKWMMKKSLRNLPLIGRACEKAGHIFVDKRGPKAIQHTIEQGERVLNGGTSLVVFPEGARTFTGHMGLFRKGAFQLACELGLEVVPVTIDGSFDVLPRMKGFNFVEWHPLRLTIHRPIPTKDRDLQEVTNEAYDSVMSGLPERHKGYVENTDQ